MSTKLEQYKIFNEAATYSSFSIAARNLFISQPAISQAISSLEKELQTPLFIRLSKGVALTKEGEILHKNIQPALILITDAENKIANYQSLKDGELVIAAGDSFSEYYLMKYLAKFHELYPKVKIKVINRTSLEIIDLLKNSQIDLGFVNLPINETSLTIKSCFEIHDIFVSKSYIDQVFTYNELAKKPLIMLENTSNSRHFIDSKFAKQGINIIPSIELGSHSLLLDFVKMDLGIACVIKEFSSAELDKQEVYEVKIKPSLPKRTIGFAYPTYKRLSASTLKFIEIINNKTL